MKDAIKGVKIVLKDVGIIIKEFGISWVINRVLYSLKLKMMSVLPFTERFFEKKVSIKQIDIFELDIKSLQKFLEKLPQGRVIQILDDYDGNYREQFYNICENVVCHILTRMSQNMYEDCRKEQLLWHLIQQQYDADERLYSYLKII